jgi:tetratricopeptide (TPR) repeat protein
MKSQLPDTDPAIYHVLEQLGITLRACFRFEDARQHQEQAVAGMELCLGERDMRTLVAMEELAITYKELGTVHMESNKELARQYLETAHRHAVFVVEQRKKQLGDKQPYTWMAQGTLGRIKAAMGDVDEAERLFSSILPVAARHLGDDHLGVLSHKNHYSKILIQQKRYREAETFLLDISRPAKYKTATFTGDHPDRWDALWTLVECYQKQGKIDCSLATCDELLGAVRAIRQGKEQTEMSSTFWEMVLDKRAELVAIKDSGIVEDSTSVALGSPSDNLAPAVLHPAVHTMSSDTQIVATPGVGDLRLRGTTW